MHIFCKRLAVKSSLPHFFVAALKYWEAKAESRRWRLSQIPTFVHLVSQICFSIKAFWFAPLCLRWREKLRGRKIFIISERERRNNVTESQVDVGVRWRWTVTSLQVFPASDVMKMLTLVLVSSAPTTPEYGKDTTLELAIISRKQTKSAMLCGKVIPQTKRKMEIDTALIWFHFLGLEQ